MKRPYETCENITLYDVDAAEEFIDKKHLHKVIDDIFYAFNFQNKDYGDILILRDMFEKGYIAAHIDIKRDEMRDKYPESYRNEPPFYRDVE